MRKTKASVYTEGGREPRHAKRLCRVEEEERDMTRFRRNSQRNLGPLREVAENALPADRRKPGGLDGERQARQAGWLLEAPRVRGGKGGFLWGAFWDR